MTRQPYEWPVRVRQFTCPICGRTMSTTSLRQKYCRSPECQLVRYERKKAKLYVKRAKAKLRKETKNGSK